MLYVLYPVIRGAVILGNVVKAVRFVSSAFSDARKHQNIPEKGEE